jgi:hypothetical protein
MRVLEREPVSVDIFQRLAYYSPRSELGLVSLYDTDNRDLWALCVALAVTCCYTRLSHKNLERSRAF